MIYLPTDSNLQCGKCYTMQFDVADFTTDIDLVFGLYLPDVGLGEQFIVKGDIGKVTSNGTKAFTFNTEECGLLDVAPTNCIRLDGGTATLTNFSLYLDEDCVGSLCSECYEVQPDCKELHVIEYWNDEDSFNVYYNNANYKQRLLIGGRITAIDYPYPVEEIHKYGDGRKAPIKTDTEEVFEFVTKQLPDYLIDALRVALKHKNLYINGESVCKVEGNIQPEFAVEESLASQVVFQFQKNNQDLFADIV